MNIARQDRQHQRIAEEILKRKKILKNTYNDLKKTDNKIYFEPVLDECTQYYNNIRNEKLKQYDAFKIISEHLDKLIQNPNIFNEKNEMLKNDQADILKQLIIIRKELQDIP